VNGNTDRFSDLGKDIKKNNDLIQGEALGEKKFGSITNTWNPITGCLHKCIYCWARRFARRLASMGVEPYKTNLFAPAFAKWRLKQRFGRGKFIFVGDMGDMWGNWVPSEWISEVLEAIKRMHYCGFFFLTKNPRRYREFEDEFSENIVLGVTIETNRDYLVTNAPSPKERYKAIKEIDWPNKAIVIEPILDFDPEFIGWIKEISPSSVYVEYDNYNNRLPEPPRSKTERLVAELSRITDVRVKNVRKAWFEKKEG